MGNNHNEHRPTFTSEPTIDGFMPDHTGAYAYEVKAGRVTGKVRKLGERTLIATDIQDGQSIPGAQIDSRTVYVQHHEI